MEEKRTERFDLFDKKSFTGAEYQSVMTWLTKSVIKRYLFRQILSDEEDLEAAKEEAQLMLFLIITMHEFMKKKPEEEEYIIILN